MHSETNQAPDSEWRPHVVSAPVLVGTWLALLALTVITVAVARVDLGDLNVVAALGIASVKATLVALFFMHLKYDHHFNRVVLIVSLLFAIIFAGGVLFDTTQYQEDITAKRAADAVAPKDQRAPAKKPASTTPPPSGGSKGDRP